MPTNENEGEIIQRYLRGIKSRIDSLPEEIAALVVDRLNGDVFVPAPVARPEPVEAEAPQAFTEVTEANEKLTSLHMELTEIAQRRDMAQNELEVLVNNLAQHETQLEEVSQGIVAAKAEAAGAAAVKLETEVEIARLTQDAASARNELKQFSDRRDELAAELAEASTLISEAEQIRKDKQAAEKSLAKLEERSAEFEGYRRAGESARRFLERLWPEWLLTGALTEWKSRIEVAVADAASPPSFGLLFAAVHSYNAALRDSDPKTLLDGLRDVGRRLYAWLRDIGQSEADAAHVAEQWAQAINADCANRGEIEVPIPGNAANNQWMIFQPRGGSSPDVASVRSWCVRDAQKRPVHRAEVSV